LSKEILQKAAGASPQTKYGHQTKKPLVVSGYEHLVTEDDYPLTYLRSEYDHQVERMKALGINVEALMFEQCVNTLLYMLEHPQAASPQTGWVKISEQLPEHKQRVLAFGEYGGKPTIKTALFHAGQKYTTEQWYWSGWEEFKITHWISLPEPPIEAAFQGSASDQNTNQ
jgi:hypothetical protein